MEETDELFKKFELDDTKLKNEMKNINMKRKKFASQVKTIYSCQICQIQRVSKQI